MRNTVDILGVSIDNVGMQDVLSTITSFLKEGKNKVVFTPNSEIIMLAKDDPEIRNILNGADLSIPDGIGVVYASKIMGKPLPERVTGFDTMQNLLGIGSNGSITFYLFGAKPGVAQEAKERLKAKYPQINILGTHDGYFNDQQGKNIISEINKLKPDVLFVALGAPKQEKWIIENKNNLNVKVCMGIGGCFDIIAGRTKRAPKIYQKLGLEWFYRFIKEPSRWRRMLKLPQFGLTVMWNRLREKKKRSE